MVGVAVSVAVISQERALREGSARAAEKFDVIVAPQGSRTDALLTGVYLQPGSARLLSSEATALILNDDQAAFASPLAFGDNYRGHPVVGAVADLAEQLSGGQLAEGIAFSQQDEAILGANVELAIGDEFYPAHGLTDRGDDSAEHTDALTIVGRMAPTGSAWDNAIVVPVEFVWHVHEDHETEAGDTHDQEEIGHVDEHDHGEHHEEEVLIGGPYTVDNPGVPAIVLRAASFADAYRLRDEYTTDETMAFFPAEVLLGLYQTLGDVSFILFVMSVCSALLVVVAIVAALFIMFRLLMTQFVTLRALGAPRRFILGVSWGISASIFTIGTVVGLGVGLVLAYAVGLVIQQRTGMMMTPGLGRQELVMAGSIWAIGIVAGVVPALYIAKKPLWQTIRSY